MNAARPAPQCPLTGGTEAKDTIRYNPAFSLLPKP